MTFGTHDPEVGRRMEEKVIAGEIVYLRVGRGMPGLLRRVGLGLISSRSWVLTEIGRVEVVLASLQSFAVLLPNADVATTAEVETFVAEETEASVARVFFAGANFYAMAARRQAGQQPHCRLDASPPNADLRQCADRWAFYSAGAERRRAGCRRLDRRSTESGCTAMRPL